MSGDLKALKTVAELDANILDLEAQRSNIPKLIEAKKSSLAHTQAELQKKDAELKGLVAKTALKEGDLKAAEQSVVKFREQIGQAKSNKEFQALQHEILSKEADNSRLEETVLLQMQKSDKKKEERDTVAEELKQAEYKIDDECAAMKGELEGIGSEIDGLRAKREAAKEGVPADILGKYERLIDRRGQTAMVAAINGTCQGCFMQLRAETMAHLRKGADLVFCHSCARILYLEQ